MTATLHHRRMARQQGGWVGLIGLLIALLIVAWLSRTLIRRLLPDESTTTMTHAGNRVPGGLAPADVDVTTTTPSPRNELQRSRGLESAVRDQAADLSKRIDAEIK